MPISKEQMERDSIVRRQYEEWLRRSAASTARVMAGMEPILVESLSRPGVVYRSMKFLQN